MSTLLPFRVILKPQIPFKFKTFLLPWLRLRPGSSGLEAQRVGKSVSSLCPRSFPPPTAQQASWLLQHGLGGRREAEKHLDGTITCCCSLTVAASVGLFSWCGIIGGPSTDLPLGWPSCGFYGSGRGRQPAFHVVQCFVVFPPLQTSSWMGTLWKMMLGWLSSTAYIPNHKKDLHFLPLPRVEMQPLPNAFISPFLSVPFSQTHVTH